MTDAPPRHSHLQPALPPSQAELEAESIARCQAGHADGLEQLYRLYSDVVFRTCFRILGDRESAEDATQEVFLQVHAKIRRFEGRSRFATWLYRLTVHHALNTLRSRKRREARSPIRVAATGPTGNEPEAPDRRVLHREAQDHLQQALSQLSDDHRVVLVLREIEELSYREISQVLGLPMGTVMSRLARARNELRRRWEGGWARAGNRARSLGVQK